ncbi:MAG: tetratricopeptide repeat protein [Acidobacteria bacterium]|nr:tetratricopeptide repeat protein [Acidobacteriota bacterium]
MSKENVLFVIIGLLGGLIIGFVFANSVNQRAAVTVTGPARQNANIPPGHPEVPGAGGGGMQPEIRAAIDQAKKEPDNFDAQLKAAEFYYQIERFDGSIEFLKRANQLKPDSREVIVHLGNAYFDSGKYEDAERWYTSALAKRTDDVGVRTDLGLTFLFREKPDYDRAIKEFTRSLELDPNHAQTLQNLTVAYTKKGDSELANRTLARLEIFDPTNESLAKLREDIQKAEKK